ncbi:hypothetical protein DNTS_031829 [Danionella cerebrum]|uniref:Proline-rich transmembrane protein 3/4 domain-containing protein n=1 Tax=Danionella cerebrum TaxID=2873325 RepID=A0A553NAF5_9TELE|nr:hypothetical protein DNTS_031829 [Danionella translucida]TRY62421.1 hypothetical protein DNTS_031829 [Danionella translucida]
MIPHNPALRLLHILTLCAHLNAESFLKEEQVHFWPYSDLEGAGSTPWTSQTSKTEKLVPASLSPKVLNPKETTTNHQKLQVTAGASPTQIPWMSMKTDPPSDIQNDEDTPQTEESDWPNHTLRDKNEKLFKTSLETLEPVSPQTWTIEPKHRNTETYISQKPMETWFGTYQTPYVGETLDATTFLKSLLSSEEAKDLTDVAPDTTTEMGNKSYGSDEEENIKKNFDQDENEGTEQSISFGAQVTVTYPQTASPTDDWSKSTTLPDCSLVGSGICQSIDSSRNQASTNNYRSTSPPLYESTHSNVITPPVEAMTPPLLVPLMTDWNAAMATWGLAWELQVYGIGCVFLLVASISVLSLLCLPLRWPSGCAHFSLLHLLQLLTSSSRALWLLYDPYGQKDRLPLGLARLLHEAAYPCLTASFGLLLLLLTARSCTQLLSQNTLQRSTCLLAALVLLHLAIVMVSLAILQLFPNLQVVPLLPSAVFVLMSSILSFTYLLLYCCARADVKHIYRLNESSPERPPCHVNRCPFTEAQMWERAAKAGVFSALFLLACGCLRLYAMLQAGGLTGGAMVGLMPWPWWGFHLSCRVCETGVCLTLALVISHPLLCCGVPNSKPGGCRWLFKKPQTDSALSSKPTILSSRCGWSLRPAEKLGLCEGIARRESESVPLYTLVDLPHSESDGLDLHYPSSPQHETSTHLVETTKKCKASHVASFVGLDTDSTVDLRPPSPIDLRRSIDEALNSEALFQHSLFGSSRLSLSTRGPPDGQPCRGNSTEISLYRTASCGDVDHENIPCQTRHITTISGRPVQVVSVHCSGLQSSQHSHSIHLHRGTQSGQQLQRRYTTLGSTSSRESTDIETVSHVDELAIQAEFINVCRQIDALSISSDTIDL